MIDAPFEYEMSTGTARTISGRTVRLTRGRPDERVPQDHERRRGGKRDRQDETEAELVGTLRQFAGGIIQQERRGELAAPIVFRFHR